MNLYPLQFYPQLHERIWGGVKLNTVLNKAIPNNSIGESWELSTVPNNVSIISNGAYANLSFQELINQFPNEVLGTKVYKKYGNQFPLLFKFLDAREDLSIQVHPNDALAQKRHNSFGKTEMWYVVQAEPEAKIIVGFKENSSQDIYVKHLKEKSLLDLLDVVPAQAGDVFFLETGTVHAIGAGCLIAEIQQTSDITYRIYDFDRVDAHGKTRELHTEQALDAINYNKTEAKVSYRTVCNEPTTLVNCDYFTTKLLEIDSKLSIQKNTDSFVVYMCVEGSGSITVDNLEYSFALGHTVLLPASLVEFAVQGNAKLLEITIL